VSRPLLLAYRALGLGDLLTAVPALRGLRDAFPRHRLVLAAPAALAPVAHLTGAVDAVVDTEPLAVPARCLHGADVAVDLHGRGPESHRAVLAAGPRRLIAFASADVPWDGPRWRAGEHEVERWCRLLRESGIQADPARLDVALPPTPRGGSGAVIVHPGASCAARRWPAERWAAVARAQREAGRRVLVTGSRAERALGLQVARAAGLPAGDVLAGHTDLAELAALVGWAALLLSGDTGVAHLATALGTPSVVLYGPTPPAEWGPPADRPAHAALYRGERGDPHANRPDPGLLDITVEEVLAVTHAVSGREPVG